MTTVAQLVHVLRIKTSKDTWALTKGLETPPYEVGGHEMVITGYDDNAFALDDQGQKHRGLLTLRKLMGHKKQVITVTSI